jgi:hypothetical protein
MSFHVEQLIFTCIPTIGFKTLVSPRVPTSVQQAFIKYIAHRYWDTYNPPAPDYRAVYLLQVRAGYSLFGWLYNDGVDDLGRHHVPYFLCYYLEHPLTPGQLQTILACLQQGPLVWIKRQHLSIPLKSLQIRDWKYQPARPGVRVPREIYQCSQHQLWQGQDLDLFLSNRPAPSEAATLATQASIHDLLALKPSQPQPRVADRVIFLRSVSIGMGIGIFATMALIASFKGGVQPQDQESSPPQLTAPWQREPIEFAAVPEETIWSVAVHSANVLLSGSSDRTIKAWDLRTGELRQQLAGHQDTVWSVATSAERQRIASGSSDQTAKVWNLADGRLLHSFHHPGPVWSVAMSPDGQLLASGSGQSIYLWSLRTGEPLPPLQGHQDTVRAIALSSDGQTLVSGSSDRTLKVWDLRTGNLLRTFSGHQARILSVAISPDQQTLVSGSVDRTLKVWNLQTGQLLYSLSNHPDWVNALAISPEGQTLASGIGPQIKVWNLQTGALIQTLNPDLGDITSLAFSNEGKTLVSGSRRSVIGIWQATEQGLSHPVSLKGS